MKHKCLIFSCNSLGSITHISLNAVSSSFHLRMIVKERDDVISTCFSATDFPWICSSNFSWRDFDRGGVGFKIRSWAFQKQKIFNVIKSYQTFFQKCKKWTVFKVSRYLPLPNKRKKEANIWFPMFVGQKKVTKNLILTYIMLTLRWLDRTPHFQ